MVAPISVEQYLSWSYDFIDKHLYQHASQMADKAHLPRGLVAKSMCSGKRFRPMLVFLSAQACGGNPENAVGLASAAEIIHESTLFHDDVIDEDKTRRGMPTFNQEMGNKMAILMGDLGLSYSIDVVRRTASDLIGLTAATISDIGIGFIREGVDRVFDSEGPLLDIIGMKTGKLFSLACTYGGKSANAPSQWVESLRNFGMNLGMSFQIADDFCSLLEGLEGEGFTDGVTLPLFYMYIQQPHLKIPIFQFGQGEVGFEDIKDELNGNLGGLTLAKKKLFNYNLKAINYAKQLPESPFRNVMCQLPSFVVNKMISEGKSGVIRRWNAIKI